MMLFSCDLSLVFKSKCTFNFLMQNTAFSNKTSALTKHVIMATPTEFPPHKSKGIATIGTISVFSRPIALPKINYSFAIIIESNTQFKIRHTELIVIINNNA